jgi:hypothetical protein
MLAAKLGCIFNDQSKQQAVSMGTTEQRISLGRGTNT